MDHKEQEKRSEGKKERKKKEKERKGRESKSICGRNSQASNLSFLGRHEAASFPGRYESFVVFIAQPVRSTSVCFTWYLILPSLVLRPDLICQGPDTDSQAKF